MSPGTVEQAQAAYEAGDFEQALESAVRGLADEPDEPQLLRLAGKASSDLGRDDASTYLEKLVQLRPDDSEAWRELGDVLVFEGRLAEATEALRRAVELRPDDTSALIDLGHSAYGAGRTDEAIAVLEQAVERGPENGAARHSLVEMYRGAGRLDDALAAAKQLADADPADVEAALAVAELTLQLDRLGEAVSAFARLRRIDVDPEHEVYAYHGMIDAEIRRQEWRGALDLALEATRVDRLGRTTDVLAFVVAKLFGESGRRAPAREEVEAALASSHAEHRRLHSEALVF